MLVAKGYPDLGWNPIEGERYLSFLRFAVFCNGMLNYFKTYFMSTQRSAAQLWMKPHEWLTVCPPHTR